jgi:PQQ-like domain
MVAVFFSLCGVPSMARARGVAEFEFRVDLARGKSTKLFAWSSPAHDEPIRLGPPEPWWRAPTDGAPIDFEVRVESPTELDEANRRPGAPPALVVSAKHRDRLRLPGPVGRGELLWHALKGDVLLVAWRGSNGRDDEAQLSGPEQYWGIDLARGAVRWRRTSSDQTNQALDAGDGRIIVYGHEAFTLVDAGTGRVVWQLPRAEADADPVPAICPIAHARLLVISSEMRAVDGAGHVVWTVPMGPHQSTLCRASGDRALVAWQPRTSSTSRDVVAMAVDAASGRVAWQTHAEGGLSQVALVGGGLALGTTSGLTRLDSADGHVVWKLDGFGSEAQALRDGDWFLPGGPVCARIDAMSGLPRWRFNQPCVRVGESRLLVVDVERRDWTDSRVWLRQYSFADRHLIREDIVQQYSDFADGGYASVSVSAAPDGFAYVRSRWVVFD